MGIKATFWKCPNCGWENHDYESLTAQPLCENCDELFHWNDVIEIPEEDEEIASLVVDLDEVASANTKIDAMEEVLRALRENVRESAYTDESNFNAFAQDVDDLWRAFDAPDFSDD